MQAPRAVDTEPNTMAVRREPRRTKYEPERGGGVARAAVGMEARRQKVTFVGWL